VYTIHATKKLLDRMQEPIIDSIPDATTRLGNWFAKPLFWRPQVTLFVNEETFLPVFSSLVPACAMLWFTLKYSYSPTLWKSTQRF
jgi:hypothetical protein